MGLAAFGAAAAFKGKATGRRFGGIVEDGISGRDTFPSLLTRGEAVIPATLTQQLRSVLGVGGGGPADTALGDVSRETSGATTVNIKAESLVPQTTMDFRRTVRDVIVPELMDLNARGMFNLRAA